jgi:hypothetical protein
MLKDSLYLSVPVDTLAYKTQLINDQFTKVHHVVGTCLVGLWILGLLYIVFIFKRP